ncbi:MULTISPECIES: hypothetical protein [unclassified Streptomyces]|uniref:hypothetical protein n=1 Tax=unclassified Streptomyces TaxID=2593676 RepID=UPI002E81C1A7|nr:hypothetical protein [Streptomyces sp. NBC_00589]WTI38820.1 hypothetical protein OIC96_29495 [Streptomyces sp. NBC_00775]WUB27500.1 hypothetical protein OHA51_20240 [Streptomyces sp. NBC_00589]
MAVLVPEAAFALFVAGCLLASNRDEYCSFDARHQQTAAACVLLATLAATTTLAFRADAGRWWRGALWLTVTARVLFTGLAGLLMLAEQGISLC